LFLVKYGLAAAFVAVLLAFGLGISDPGVTRWAALHVFAAFACLLIFRPVDLPKQALWGVSFALWCALSLCWSVDWRGGAVELANGIGLLAVFLVGACADRDMIRDLIGKLIAVVIVAAGGLCIVYPQWFGGFGNENFQVEAFLAVAPFVFLARGWWLKIISGLVCAYFIASTGSNLKWLVIGGWGLMGLVWVGRAGFPWAAWIAGTFALVIGLASGIVGADMFHSVLARAEISINTLAMWLNSPIWGHGLGSFNPLYPEYQERHLHLLPSIGTVFGADMSYFAGAAHNEYAQVLAEYGLIGAALLGGLIWSIVKAERRDSLDWVCLATLFNLGVVSLVEFPFQNAHTAVIGALAAGLILNGRDTMRAHLVARLPAVAVAGFMAWAGFYTYQAYRWFSITETVNASDPYSGVLANFRAYQEFSWPRHIRHQLAVSLNAAIEKDPDSIRIDPASADILYGIALKAAGPATAIELGRIEYLLMAGRWQERRGEIEDRLAWMRQNASHHAAVWLVEGKWALLVGDKTRALHAAETGEALPNTFGGYKDYIRTIALAARNED
jgi:O-antigen ligase